MIDPVRELSVRAIAHNLARHVDNERDSGRDPVDPLSYARRLAGLFVTDSGEADSMATAAVALYDAAGGRPVQLPPLDLTTIATGGQPR